MSEQLWTDKRIKTTFGDSLLMHGKFVAQLVKQMRDEYEARIAELEAEKKAQANYIARLEAAITPEQLFDAAS